MLRIYLSNEKQSEHINHAEGPLELGRGAQREARRFRIDDHFVSRDHLRVEELADGRVQVENLSLKNPVTLVDGTRIAPGCRLELKLPVYLTVGKTEIVIRGPALSGTQEPASGKPAEPSDPFDTSTLLSIAQPIRAPSSAQARRLLSEDPEAPASETLVQWLEAVIALQQTAADSTASYQQTARAMVELIGLDLGLVVLRKPEGWAIAGSHAAGDSVSVSYSRTLLNHVVTERRTFYQDVNMFKSASVSLGEIEAVVASPIFGLHDDVVGILYGMRTRGVLARGGVRRLEAQLVQLLAATVGANLARFTTEHR